MGPDGAIRAQYVARRMSGIDVLPDARRGIEFAEQERDETFFAEIFDQQMAGLRQDVFETQARQCQRAQIGAGVGHEHRGPQPVAGDIPHHDQQPPVGRRNEVEVVAAGGGGRPRGAGDVVAGQHRRPGGEQLLLDFARDAEFFFLSQQRAFGLAMGAALLRLGQFARHGGHQPRQVAFHQVVLRARPHRGHRRFFADHPGHDDERHVEGGRPHDLQRFRGVEARHVVVGKDNVPFMRVQRSHQVFRVVHPAGVGSVPSRPQLFQQQQRIDFGVFDDEDFQRLGRCGGRDAHGASPLADTGR